MKILVIDGNSIINRAFYGVRALTTKDGFYSNAIYGFLMILNKLTDEIKPDYAAIAFDLPAPTFRHKLYDGYKANRKGMPEELAQQMPVLKQLLVALGYKTIECEGYEADDIIGTLTKKLSQQGEQCYIATGDRDYLQLVDDNITVLLAATRMGKAETIPYDCNKVMEEYGVKPPALIDIKALMGDSSDCIPGVAGIGQKTACTLIQKFGSLAGVYENIDSPDIKAGVRTKLNVGKDMAQLSRTLGEINKESPIDTNIDSYVINEPTAESLQIMNRLELFSIIKKMGLDKRFEGQGLSQENTDDKIESQPEKMIVKQCSDLDEIADKINKAQKIYISYGSNADGQYICVSFDEGEIYIVRDMTIALSILQSNAGIYSNNLKPLFSLAIDHDCDITNAGFDVSIAGYLLDASASDYDCLKMAIKYGIEAPTERYSDIEDEGLRSNVVIAAILPQLCHNLASEIEKNDQHKLYYDIEIPLCRVLCSMEQLGFELDIDSVKQYREVLLEQAQDIQSDIYNACGCEFNINSPKQLGEVLFVRLGLKGGKKTKTGWSTGAQVLEELADKHPVIAMVLEYRTVTKLISTYCDGLLTAVAEDGRVHSNFNQTETRTGRISSAEPNLQNIPIRTDRGRQFRRFFRAKSGCVLIDADYSQIELRVLAHIADDSVMIKAFKEDEDIHTITASEVFDIPPQLVTPLMRSRAKAVNFGIVYGIGAFSLSKDIGVSVAQAKSYIDGYLNHYSGVNKYMESVVEAAKQTGYVTTLLNRRRYLPELKMSNRNMKAFGERVARNMPIQGTAADIIKIAMVRVYERLKKEQLKAKLILQVHDELLCEAPEEEAEQVKDILREEMANALQMSVPLKTDVGIGKTWYDAH